MTRKEFQELAKQKILLLDGATGSNLQKRGMPAGVCPELWITEHPEVLKTLQEEYAAAGSDIVYAPTFGGNRIKMEEYGLGDRLKEINTELVRISREAAGENALVAGDLTMTGAQLEPLGDLTFDQLYEVYREQAAILADAGADLLIVETMMSLQETRAAVLAAREACPDLAVMATMSFTESGNTLYGASAESAAVVLQGLGVDAVGLNCSAGPDKMLGVLKRMAAVADIPLIAKPNAGLPQVNEAGETVYDMAADVFAGYMREMIPAGAGLLGGCCGTAPDYIGRLAELTRGKVPAAGERKEKIFLANERCVYPFAPGQELNLGGGIDYTKDEELLEEWREGVFDTALDTAYDLMDEEADALLFCAGGLPDEGRILAEAIAEVTQTVRLPVVIATEDPAAADQVLREYSGTAAVLFSSPDDAADGEMRKVLKRYGAAAVTIDKKIVCC